MVVMVMVMVRFKLNILFILKPIICAPKATERHTTQLETHCFHTLSSNWHTLTSFLPMIICVPLANNKILIYSQRCSPKSWRWHMAVNWNVKRLCVPIDIDAADCASKVGGHLKPLNWQWQLRLDWLSYNHGSFCFRWCSTSKLVALEMFQLKPTGAKDAAIISVPKTRKAAGCRKCSSKVNITEMKKGNLGERLWAPVGLRHTLQLLLSPHPSYEENGVCC